MFVIRKQFKFELSHQLDEAYSKSCTDCIHGHSYLCEVFFKSKDLDETGMVIDFGLVKKIIGNYMNQWDHALALSEPLYNAYMDNEAFRNNNKKVIKTMYNPTAEEMSRDIYNYIKKVLKAHAPHVSLKSVRLHETTTGWAEYSEE